MGTIDIIIQKKLGLGQHTLWRQLIATPAIFSVILFERFPDILEGELADAKPYGYPHSSLRLICNLHRPAIDVTDIADARAAADLQARPPYCTARIHLCQVSVMADVDRL